MPGDKLVRDYSGGMRRRLDLGASLVGRPHLLLLDEPTTGLDPRSRIELWEAIRGLVADGTDVLLTTQYLEEADQLARDVVIIDHGRVIASGTPDELKNMAGSDVIEVRPRHVTDLEAVRDALATIGSDAPRIDHDTQRVTRRGRRRRQPAEHRGAPARRGRDRVGRHRPAPTHPRRGVPGPHRPTDRQRRTRRRHRRRGLNGDHHDHHLLRRRRPRTGPYLRPSARPSDSRRAPGSPPPPSPPPAERCCSSSAPRRCSSWAASRARCSCSCSATSSAAPSIPAATSTTSTSSCPASSSPSSCGRA